MKYTSLADNQLMFEREKETIQKKEQTANTPYVHWLADPVKTGQAVHSGSFAPALVVLIFDSLCRFTTANAHSFGR